MVRLPPRDGPTLWETQRLRDVLAAGGPMPDPLTVATHGDPPTRTMTPPRRSPAAPHSAAPSALRRADDARPNPRAHVLALVPAARATRRPGARSSAASRRGRTAYTASTGPPRIAARRPSGRGNAARP